MQPFQQTIAKAVQIEGVGLHSGKKVTMELLPAPSFCGINFLFIKENKKINLKADVNNITKTTLSTSLGMKETDQVHTVEHLLSALYGLGLDNLIIKLNDVEVPILDGSGLPFVNLILEAGIIEQTQKKSIFTIRKKIQVEEKGKFISILPYPGMKISYSIDFDHPFIGQQKYSLRFSKDNFIREIAPARTFGFLSEVQELKKRGFIQGGSLENAVVIDRTGILNKEGLRFSNEFVRHKILDLIGDFSLLGHPVQGHIIAHCAGHSLHAKLLEKLLHEKDSWELVDEKPVSLQEPVHPSTVSFTY